MDFGAYLKSILADRNVNISHLAEQTGIKSKNTFYRLFQNYYSFDKTKEITEKILCVVDVTPDERSRIFKLMKMCRMNKDVLSACRLMQTLYMMPQSADFKSGGTALWQREDCEEVCMFMGMTSTHYPAQIAAEILNSGSPSKKSLTHYVHFPKEEPYIAGALFSMMKLCSFDEYDCISVKKNRFADLIGFVKLKNGYGYFIAAADGEYAQTELSEEFYRFIFKQYACEKGKSLKHHSSTVTGYADLLSDFAIVETNDLFTFEGMFCFGDFPFEIMYSQLKDANFLGLPPDCDYVKNLIAAAQNRQALRNGSASHKTYIISEHRLRCFLKTGCTIDHPAFLRPLTREEIRTVIGMISAVPNRCHFRFHKPGFCENMIQCGVVKDKSIFMWNADSGYEADQFHIMINDARAVKFYESFFEYFWQFCALPQEQSNRLFEDILNEYDITL